MKPWRPIVMGCAFVEGQIRLDNRKLFAAALRHKTGRGVVTVSPEVQARSQRQNAYLFGVVYKAIADESGYSVDDVHELMKLRHNSKLVVDPFTGEEQKIAQSTAKLGVDEFSVYIERVMVDGAEQYGLSFPPPRTGEDR